MAWTTLGCWCPSVSEMTCCDDRSRYRLPSASQNHAPYPPATAMRSNHPWADQENSVYCRFSSTMSCAVRRDTVCIVLLVDALPRFPRVVLPVAHGSDWLHYGTRM